MRTVPVALAVLAVLATGPAQVAEAVDHALSVNVVSAVSLGCSPDAFTSPDLRVTVELDGDVVLQTTKAQDQRRPLYAHVEQVAREAPVTVRLRIEEAEPGGFLMLGTSWVACDAADGSATVFETVWDGRSTVELVARGDDDRAAEAVVIVGSDAPARPVVEVREVTAEAATVAWDADASGRATRHRLAWGGVGPVIAEGPGGAGAHRLAGLCDNVAFTVRVVRDAGPWVVASADATFRTENAPPPAPRVLQAERDGANVTVTFSWSDAHDAREMEIHAGGTSGFAPGENTRRAVVAYDPPFSAEAATFVAGPEEAYVRLLLRDTGGLTTPSEVFAVGAPPAEAGWDSRSCTMPFATPAGDADAPPDDPQDEPVRTENERRPSREADAPTTGPGARDPAPQLPWPLVFGIAASSAVVGGIVVAIARRRP